MYIHPLFERTACVGTEILSLGNQYFVGDSGLADSQGEFIGVSTEKILMNVIMSS